MQHYQLTPYLRASLDVMKNRLINTLTFFFALLIACGNLNAADIERESKLAAAIKDSLIVGEVVTLKANNNDFIGLVNKETPIPTKGSILILHGMGSNPNAPQLIHPLRDQLTELGWVTLAIQLPLLPHDAPITNYMPLIKESSPRITAALNYLKENFPNKPCTMVAHSFGAIMATNFLASQEKLACDAFVFIGLPALPSELSEANSTELLKKISIPMFDIFGSQDLPSVRQLAPSRKATLTKGNPLNRQLEVQGADHLFTGLDESLVLSIHSWLTSVTQQP